MIRLHSICSSIAVIHTGYDLIYDTKAWSFHTGAAVRATPLIKNGTIYIGNAKGRILCHQPKDRIGNMEIPVSAAIDSSASIANGKVFFADNKQSVYALDEKTGRQLWVYKMGKKLDYPWRFDYYQSSPSLCGQDLLVGGDDGYLYRLSQATVNVAGNFRQKASYEVPLLFIKTLFYLETRKRRFMPLIYRRGGKNGNIGSRAIASATKTTDTTRGPLLPVQR